MKELWPVPERDRQCRHWQCNWATGSPFASYRMAPQVQPPVYEIGIGRILSGGSVVHRGRPVLLVTPSVLGESLRHVPLWQELNWQI
jgi:hypothetical protein